MARRRRWVVPYPRCAVVPLALSYARACSVQRDCPGGHGVAQVGSAQGCQARATMCAPLEQDGHPFALAVREGGVVGSAGVAPPVRGPHVGGLVGPAAGEGDDMVQ